MITKICKKCTVRQPLTNFNEYEPGRKRNICKVCQRAKCVDWEAANIRRNALGLPPVNLVKTCPKCKLEKPREAFSLDLSRRDGLCSACKDCWKIRSAEVYRKNPEKEIRRRYVYRLVKTFNMTLEQKEELFNKQGRVCAICKSENVGRKIKGIDQTWPVDHDHKTGKVRGILCSPCNLVLGLVNDSKDRLSAMIGYLKENESS